MKRKAVIMVEFEAEDYFNAQAKEDQIRGVLALLPTEFAQVDVRFIDRRPRLTPRARAPQRSWPRG